jgi:hypothetical protein
LLVREETGGLEEVDGDIAPNSQPTTTLASTSGAYRDSEGGEACDPFPLAG